MKQKCELPSVKRTLTSPFSVKYIGVHAEYLVVLLVSGEAEESTPVSHGNHGGHVSVWTPPVALRRLANASKVFPCSNIRNVNLYFARVKL